MRSDTLMPMLQFTDWWGLNPWFVAGIDYEGVTNPGGSPNGDPTDTCICMFQHPWDSKSHWSRDELIELINEAELFFINEAKYYPSLFEIVDERKQNNNRGSSGFTFFNNNGNYKSIKPNYACNLQEFGIHNMSLNSLSALTRDDAGVMRDEFTVTIAVPLGTEAENVRAFFTSADGAPLGDPEFNDHSYEIRPLTISVSGVSATISGPAYLFKKPELDEETVCVYHELTTYVENINVYITERDNCLDGNFICNNNNCDTTPCVATLHPVCITTRSVGGQLWGVPQIAQCDEDLSLANYCLDCLPDEIEYNYLTGVNTSVGGYMDENHVSVLSKLALGLADCVKKWCDCDVCSNKKMEHYRDTPNALFKRETSRQEYDLSWQIVLSDWAINKLDGLPPYNGILQAIRFIKRNKCTSVGGTTL